jgi:hypothetical protein
MRPSPSDCQLCDDTGWRVHPLRGTHVWCECPKGQAMRAAYQARRAARVKRAKARRAA